MCLAAPEGCPELNDTVSGPAAKGPENVLQQTPEQIELVIGDLQGCEKTVHLGNRSGKGIHSTDAGSASREPAAGGSPPASTDGHRNAPPKGEV
jgi:hypothetical protein